MSASPNPLLESLKRAAGEAEKESGNPLLDSLRRAAGEVTAPPIVRQLPTATIGPLSEPSFSESAKEAVFGSVRSGETSIGRLIPQGIAERFGIGGRIEANLTPEEAAATRPLVRPEAFRSTPGLVRGALEEVGQFTRPESLALIALTGAFGRILANPASRQVLQRLIAAGFGTDLLINTARQAPEFVEAIQRGDETAAREIAGRMAVRGAAGAGALGFGIRGGRGAGAAETSPAAEARPVRGFLPEAREPIITPPPADTSFVRGVPAEPPVRVVRGLLPPGPEPVPLGIQAARAPKPPFAEGLDPAELSLLRQIETERAEAGSVAESERADSILRAATAEPPPLAETVREAVRPQVRQAMRDVVRQEVRAAVSEELGLPEPQPVSPREALAMGVPEFRVPEVLRRQREVAAVERKLEQGRTTEERQALQRQRELVGRLRPAETPGPAEAVPTEPEFLRAPRGRPKAAEEGTLPGLDQAVVEQEAGAARVQGERLAEEFARPLEEPRGQAIETSPLLRGTSAAPQQEIFQAPVPEVLAPKAARKPRLLPRDAQVFDRFGDRLITGRNATDPLGNRVKVEGFVETPQGAVRAIVSRGKVREEIAAENLSVRSAPRQRGQALGGVRQFGESEQAHAERLMGPGGILGPTGELSANPIFNPRFWERADAALRPITERVDRAIDLTIGKLPVSVRRFLRDEPRTKEIIQDARREVGARQNEAEAINRMVLRENPTPEELRVADRVARGVPEDLSAVREPLRAPVREAAERTQALAQQMTSERKALGLPVREEWVEGPKHWYPNLWKQHTFSPRMVAGRLFSILRPGRGVRPSGQEMGSLRPRTTDRWTVVDANGDIANVRPGEKAIFTSGEAARSFVQEHPKRALRIMEPMTHEQAVAHGLIEDLTLNTKYGFGREWALLAKTKALDRIGRELAVDEPLPGHVSLAEKGFTVPAKLAERNPNIARLRDGYVPEEVAETLAAFYGERGVWEMRFRWLEGSLRKWVTVFSPFRHPRNLVENEISLAFGDPKAALNFPAMNRAFRDFARGARGEKGVPYWDEYAKSKLVNTDILRGEFDTVWKAIDRVQPGTAPLSLTERMALWAEGNPTARQLLRTRDLMQRAYRAEDQVWKYYEYRTLRERGVSPAQAEARARRTFFDYEDVPPIVRSANRLIPFVPNITFQYSRILGAALRDRPASSTMKIALLLYGYAFMRDELIKRAGISEQDEKNMGKLGLKPWEFPLPITDSKGRAIVVNLQWAVPFSEIELLRGAALEEDPERGFVQVARRFLPMAAQPVATAVGQRGAFGEKILTGTESRNEAAKKLARAMALGFLPGLLGQYWDRLYRNATAGEERRESLPVAALVEPTVGRLERVRPEERIEIRQVRFAGKARGLQEEAARFRGRLIRGEITPEKFRAEVERLHKRTSAEEVSHPETLAVALTVEQGREAEARKSFSNLLETGFYRGREEALDAVNGVLNLRDRLRVLQGPALPAAVSAARAAAGEFQRSGAVSQPTQRRLLTALDALPEADQEALVEWLEGQLSTRRRRTQSPIPFAPPTALRSQPVVPFGPPEGLGQGEARQ